MRLSRYFQELMLMYKAELDDLRTDSEGKDVLRRRLKEKREQLPFLLPMLEENPEMLMSAFHGAFLFMNPLSLEALSGKEQKQLPSWKSLSAAVKLEPWAEPLAASVLGEKGGDAMLVSVACLEYLQRSQTTRQRSLPVADTAKEEEDHEQHEDEDFDHGSDDRNDGRFSRDDGDDGDDMDLEEAGADWLAEQGFDRKD